MDQPTLEARLADLPLGGIRYFERVGSTNDEAEAWLKAGCPDCALVVADAQTAGRGRAGRKWFTPPGAGLAFSLVLRAGDVLRLLHAHGNTARLNGLGALAVCLALQEQYGLPAKIKWPNDILVNGRKLAGVLAEAHWLGGDLTAVVLGIGVNLTPASVPAADWDTRNPHPFPATCVESEARVPVARWDLLHEIVRNVLDWRDRIAGADFLRAWEANLAFRGQWVQVYPPGSAAHPKPGKIIGLEADGSLRVQEESGETVILRSGEIHPAHPPLDGFRLRPVDSAEK